MQKLSAEEQQLIELLREWSEKGSEPAKLVIAHGSDAWSITLECDGRFGTGSGSTFDRAWNYIRLARASLQHRDA